MLCAYQHDGPAKVALPSSDEIIALSGMINNMVLDANDSEFDALLPHNGDLPSCHFPTPK
jgi:hypothetical protein